MRRSVCLVLVSVLLSCSRGAAGTPDPSDKRYQVMAAFLFNFLSFVEWPAGSRLDEGPLLIGVLGKNPFGDAPRSIERREVNQRAIRFVFFPDLKSLEPTHILFVTRDHAGRIAEVRQALRDYPVLLVGETEEFTRQGGVMRFFEVAAGNAPGDERQVRVEVNEAAAEAQRLEIRSKLLRLTTVVNYPMPEEPVTP